MKNFILLFIATISLASCKAYEFQAWEYGVYIKEHNSNASSDYIECRVGGSSKKYCYSELFFYYNSDIPSDEVVLKWIDWARIERPDLFDGVSELCTTKIQENCKKT